MNEVYRHDQNMKLKEAEKNKVILEAFEDDDIFIDNDFKSVLKRGHLRFGIEIVIMSLKEDLGLV